MVIMGNQYRAQEAVLVLRLMRCLERTEISNVGHCKSVRRSTADRRERMTVRTWLPSTFVTSFAVRVEEEQLYLAQPMTQRQGD